MRRGLEQRFLSCILIGSIFPSLSQVEPIIYNGNHGLQTYGLYERRLHAGNREAAGAISRGEPHIQLRYAGQHFLTKRALLHYGEVFHPYVLISHRLPTPFPPYSRIMRMYWRGITDGHLPNTRFVYKAELLTCCFGDHAAYHRADFAGIFAAALVRTARHRDEPWGHLPVTSAPYATISPLLTHPSPPL